MVFLNFYFYSDATVYVGGLDEKVSESILWELFLQAGPVGMFDFDFILLYHFLYIYIKNVSTSDML